MSTTLPAIPATLPPAIVSKFNISLTESKFQDIANEEAKLIYNEDNVNTIKEFLDKTKKVVRAIEATHKDGKAEALRIGKDWDTAKNSFIAQVDAITEVPQKKYTELCLAIDKKNKEIAADNLRKDTIKKGIETNAVNFALQIANAKTTAELTRIESVINLEKSRKEKYQEFLPDAVTKFNELNANLKNQKATVKDLEELEKKKQDALTNGNEELALEIMDKQENVTAQIEENKIVIQEAAVSAPVTNVVEVETVFVPTVKARRTTVKWKVKDLAVTQKKSPEWVQLTTVNEPIDKYMADNKATILEKGEVEVNGIIFYTEKSF